MHNTLTPLEWGILTTWTFLMIFALRILPLGIVVLGTFVFGMSLHFRRPRALLGYHILVLAGAVWVFKGFQLSSFTDIAVLVVMTAAVLHLLVPYWVSPILFPEPQ